MPHNKATTHKRSIEAACNLDDSIDPRLRALFLKLGFTAPPIEIAGRTSIADLVKPRKRCGIYILHFQDGELYAGQAKDVTRRYAQHRENYRDISHLSFRSVPEKELDKVERAVVLELRGTQRIRNVMLNVLPETNCDLDTVFPPNQQQRWLAENDYIPPISPERATQDELRRQYRHRFEQFLAKPHQKEVVDLLRDYIWACIPNPTATEVVFWNASCPGKGRLYSRISLYQQEVMATSGGHFTFHLAKSYLGEAGFSELANRFRSLRVLHYTYKAGGDDQIGLGIELREAGAFLREPQILQSIRAFNLRLMRMGPTMWARYHSPALADLIFQDARFASSGQSNSPK